MYAFLALAGLQAIGGIQQAQITRANGDLQNDIADMNAKYADLDAFNAIAEGQGNAARYESSANQAIAADKTAFAGAGVSIGYGTANDVVTDNKIAATNNVLQIQRQAQNKAAGFQTQGINIRLGGRMSQLQSNLNASAEQGAGILKAVATGVSGYAYDQSTGKGTTSKTGTDSSPTYDKGVTMNMGGGAGDGVGGRMGWYPDAGAGGQPGFYGQGPRGSSFTDEVG
jgi:hypothetical protein